MNTLLAKILRPASLAARRDPDGRTGGPRSREATYTRKGTAGSVVATSQRLATTVVTTSRRGPAIAATSFATLALGMTVLLAPSASAASTYPGDFSSLIPNNPTSGWFVDDCYGDIGFVFDPHPAGGWHHIGGVRFNCSSQHSFISATVTIYWWNGSRWVPAASNSGTKYNVSGSGYDISGILETPAVCAWEKSYSWMVGATVSTERATRTVYTRYAATDPTQPNGAC